MNGAQATIHSHQWSDARCFIEYNSYIGKDIISCLITVTSYNQCLRAVCYEKGNKMLNECNSLIIRKRQQCLIRSHSATAAASKNNAASLSRAMKVHLEEAALRLAFFDLLLFGIYCSRFLYAR